MSWQLHWLEAAGDLNPWRDAIISEVDIARRAIAGVLPPCPLDILVERQPGAVIPETGTTGRAYRENLFSLTLDPDNPNFERCLRGGDLRRTVAHEAHHCLRMAGPGYGWTLGEALVSEGLAGQFVSHLFRTPPEPWECAVTDDVLKANLPDTATLIGNGHDHRAWFFGFGGRYPRWLGYTLGYRIAGDWLDATPGIAGEAWVNVSRPRGSQDSPRRHFAGHLKRRQRGDDEIEPNIHGVGPERPLQGLELACVHGLFRADHMEAHSRLPMVQAPRGFVLRVGGAARGSSGQGWRG